MSLQLYQGTTTTCTTLQVSQSLFDLVVTEISARNEILIQSLLKFRYQATRLTLSLGLLWPKQKISIKPASRPG